MNKSLIALVIIFLVAILISMPLINPGLYVIHDDQQIARLFLFDRALRAGQFPVRWVDELGFGFGYPLFVFYPPFVYIIGELFHLIGFSFIDSIKLVFFTSIFVSGLAMYVLAKEFWGRSVGIVSALFYMLVPYRALDIYIRGALAESFAFIWLPLILWSFYKLSKTNNLIYIYISAVLLALLMITHNLIFLPFMLILPFYLLFLFLNSKDKRLITYHLSLITLLAAGLSAFFWIPAIIEKKFTIVDQLLLVNLANYNIHFVSPQQLWNWPWGFGGSAAGLADGISFKIGKLHILVSLAAFVFAVIYLIKNKVPKASLISAGQLETSFQSCSSDISDSAKLKADITYHLSLITFGLLIFSAFMTTFYSKPIWDLIPSLGYLQFPWRFLIFTSLFSSILAGAFIYLLRLAILRLVASLILIVLLFIGNFKLFKPQTYRLDLTDEIATSKQIINWDVSESSHEYIPKGVELKKSDLGVNILNIKKSEIPSRKEEIISGQAQITDLKTTPAQVKFTIDAKETSQVRINVFNFPGWQVMVDKLRVPINDNNRLKLISFTLPEGTHQVEAEFVNTPIRTVANLTTVGTFIIIGILLLWPKWGRFLTNQRKFSTRPVRRVKLEQ